ncbi:hypothetical protein QCA50_014860 [Cerrena zonata]|uniref:Uncharacterized protein n=1 Tax=Cerrena zonata TaxID=2478898 RepID=A0AAW0FL72_9APHY
MSATSSMDALQFPFLSQRLNHLVLELSRLIAMGEAGVVCAYIALSADPCQLGPFLTAAKWLNALHIPCSSWLFLLRVRAIPSQFCPREIIVISGPGPILDGKTQISLSNQRLGIFIEVVSTFWTDILLSNYWDTSFDSCHRADLGSSS